LNNKGLILIVEDEVTICNFIATTLKTKEYKVVKCGTGKEAISLITSHCPDVVLLDLGLPDMDGIDVIKEIRKWSNIPIIVVSARHDEQDKVEALDSGADDYLTKPFGSSELVARIRTSMRHSSKGRLNAKEQNIFQVNGLKINFDKRIITLDKEEVHLTQIEYKLITLLANNAGKVLTYDYMLTNIWGPYATKDNQILRVNMANIRRKIESNPADPKYIFTEVGVGYRIVEEEQ
jgi:two-component system KDP operon response regulator KdpE